MKKCLPNWQTTYTPGVTVAYAAPTRLVRVRILGGMPEALGVEGLRLDHPRTGSAM